MSKRHAYQRSGSMKSVMLLGLSVLLGLSGLPYGSGVRTASAAEAEVAAVLPLDRPAGLMAVEGSGSVTLSWTGVPGAAVYHVKRSLVNGGPYETVAGGLTSFSYTDSTVDNGTVYYYVVTASEADGTGESMISRQVKARPFAAAAGAPAKPAGLSAEAADGSVTLTWDPVPGAAGYTVQRAAAGSGSYETVVEGLTAAVHKDTAVVNGTAYDYRVLAVNTSGDSAPSDELTAVPARVITVAQDGSGDYATVQEAVYAIPAGNTARTVVYIEPGVYRERVTVASPLVSLVGAGRELTKIVYNLSNATSPGSALNGATLSVTGNGFSASNLTVENDAPVSEGQALAVLVNADQSVFENVKLAGYQDTLYTGIPAASPRIGRHYFRNSVILGRTDFIYGPATAAVFDHVDAVSINAGDSGGYVTAAATKRAEEPGLVFLDSRLLKDSTAAGLHYLGRPWQDYPNVRYINTWMDEHIHPEGWTTMQVPPSYFGEYRSQGPGANPSTRLMSHQMSAEEANGFTIPRMFGGWDPSRRTVLPKAMPQVTAVTVPAQPDGQNDTFTKPVVVSLPVSHNESGAFGVQYRVNGGEWTSYAAEFEVGTKGENTVDYRLLDESGTAGTLRTLSLRVDPDAPLRVPAFPGAEGGAMYATGGRGQSVYEVTTLADYNPAAKEPEAPIPGSLRDAVSQGNRTIVFRVSGTIQLKSELKISNNNLTIAGQTAPGGGIAISGYPVTIGGDNLIVRYLRFRAGVNQLGDTANVGGDNIIIDHCSFSWSSDETLSLKEHRNITVQWSLVSNSLNQSIHSKGSHGYGGIWGGTNVTYHHNLIVNHSSRNPRFDRQVDPDNFPTKIDYRNNVIYNWGGNSAYGGEQATGINMINNYYKPGPSTFDNVRTRIVNPSSQMAGAWFIEGNVIEGYPELSADNWKQSVVPDFGMDALTRLTKPAVVPDAADPIGGPVATDSAETAYRKVLEQVGAVLPMRDSLDARIVTDVRKGTGKIVNTIASDGGLPVLAEAAAPADGDHDGMPDAWETAHGLNPGDASDANGDHTGDGFTNLEKYMNELAAASRPLNPEVEITNLAMHAQFLTGEDIVIEAGASDPDGSVAKVEFYDGDRLLGEDAEAPYSFTWKQAAEGQHYVYAKAVDAGGTMTLSSAAIIHVNGPANAAPWISQDIGSTAIPGSASVSDAGIKVKGSGEIGAGGRDSLHFAYQPVQGNFEFTAQTAFASEIDNQLKVGLMVREILDPASPAVMLALSMDPTYHGSHALFLHRGAQGGAYEKQIVDGEQISAPYWFRLVREGGTVTGYVSQDGLNWGRIGSAAVPWAGEVYAGLAVDAAKSTSSSDYLAAALFTDVSFHRAPAFTLENPSAETVTVPKYAVHGTMTDAGRLTVQNNGASVSEPAELQEGEAFSVQVPLTEGENVITVSASTVEGDGGMVNTRTVTVTYNKLPTVIALEAPLPDVVLSPAYVLRARVNKDAAVTLLLNGTAVAEGKQVTQDTPFDVPLTLREGVNEITVSAVDIYGIGTTDTYTLTYQKDWGKVLFTVSQMTVTDLNGRPLRDWKQPQDAYVEASFHNNSAVEQSGVMVIGLFDKKDRLVRYVLMEQTVPGEASRTFRAVMSLPKRKDGDHLKAFVWKDLSGKQPVSNIRTAREEERK
ncbi:pectinesterase family protein [Paenibacillus caseinilyticus]|uniref:Pectinesterase n=1 Tax=Paenibacillus mucilaginosus K02 TaxID=997761 RepID=I0BLH3_9BACL|nr:pectinesterase family protein [Paenibacillus mucilaginosus]AFH63220.1 pectinesterase [Paenibacillus mucilaginosus K02]